MFELAITPELLTSIVAGLLAVAFDWLPKLAPWYDALSELKKKQLMSGLLLLTVFSIYGGLCIGLFASAAYSCTQASLAQLVQAAFWAVVTNQGVHALTKPTQAWKLGRA